MPKFAKLIMVTPQNNNKYYIMEEKNGELHIEFGRVDLTSTKLKKSLSSWDSIYREKIKKGYKDVTNLVTEVESVSEESTLVKLSSTKVQQFLDLMQKYTGDVVTSTYSVTYKNVTSEQVRRAQEILDSFEKINKKSDRDVNERLIELYTVIPRYMRKVQDYLVPNINLDKRLEDEQSNIDAISAQVSLYEKQKQLTVKGEPVKQTMLDILGLNMVEASKSELPEIEYLLKQITGTYKRVETLFKVEKSEEEQTFSKWLKDQSNKTTRTLIHGTRCSSVLSILKQGLKIRPSGNFQFSGKVYGDGNYFSEVVSKSLGYTGSTSDRILLVYEVHTGNPFVYNGWYKGNSFTLNYKNLKERGFDSTYVKAGNGLLNSEIIAYKEEQCKIKAIIWLK